MYEVLLMEADVYFWRRTRNNYSSTSETSGIYHFHDDVCLEWMISSEC